MTYLTCNVQRAVPLLAAVGIAMPVGAATTDPSGYISHSIPAGSQRLIGISLHGMKGFTSTVEGVSATGLTLKDAVSADLFSVSDSGFLDVRVGAFAGMTTTVTSFSGKELTLQGSMVGLVSPGDTVEVLANHTIGGLFGATNSVGLLPGADASEADTIGIWNAQTQSSRVFYFRTGEGWRESGNEGAGDQARMTIPFPAALVINRRGSTPLQVTVVGGVPMPLEQRYFEVFPGRNLISAPFSAASKISEYGLYAADSPFSVIGGASAPDSDTIRFSNFSAATDSEVIYYRLGQGWRTAGTDGDAGNTPIEIGQSMDFQRRGPAGFIKAQGILPLSSPPSGAALAVQATPVTSVPIVSTLPAAGGVQLEWNAEPGATYQVQTRLTAEETWENLGDPVLAEGATASKVCRPSGQGFLRIVQH
jgi:hypothetical protein